MYLCPKCHSKMEGNKIKCPKCNFKLKISLADYKKRELKLLDDKNSKFKSNWSKRFKFINKLLNGNGYVEYCSSSNVSKDEYFLIIYNILSQICINNSYKKLQGIENEIKREISANNKFMHISSKLNSLKHLLSLVGGKKFTEYYKEKIYFNCLNYDDGIKIFGFLIRDILKNGLQKRSIEYKINKYVKTWKSSFDKINQNLLRNYFRLTGKFYFSKKFDSVIKNNNLTVDQAFELKKRLLKNIFNAKKHFNIIGQANFHLREIRRLNDPKRYKGSHTSAYIRKVSQEYSVLGSYFRYY